LIMILKPQGNGRVYINPVAMMSHAYAWEHGSTDDLIETLKHYREGEFNVISRAAMLGLTKALAKGGNNGNNQ
jgi:hypothetical protein